MAHSHQQKHFPAAVIAAAGDCSPRTILRRARRERWARQVNGNQFEFTPPLALQARCRRLAKLVKPRGGLQPARLTAERRAEALRIVHRLFCCLLLATAVDAGEGREAALIRVAKVGSFACSPRSLRRWSARLEAHGVCGLAERKRGRVGAKPGGKKS